MIIMDEFMAWGIVGLYRSFIVLLWYFEDQLVGLKYEELLVKLSGFV